MTADEILAHPALESCVRNQAQSLLQVQEASPRIASLFATQQRWLMAHAALAQYFRNEAMAAGAGLLAERFLELVARHDIASRNTAGRQGSPCAGAEGDVAALRESDSVIQSQPAARSSAFA